MLVPFESLPGGSRIWVYQANRSLNLGEQEKTAAELSSFCEQWTAHGSPLRTSFKIDHGQFLILAVDEEVGGASGCSIDGSVKVLKSLQEALGADFFDRTRAAFLDGNHVRTIALADLKNAFATGVLNPLSKTFNTLVVTKDQLQNQWIVPLEKTWLVRYIPKSEIV